MKRIPVVALVALAALSFLTVCLVAAQVAPTTTDGATTKFTQPEPRLSEVELLRLQVVALQQQVASLNGSLEACRIEVTHPGFRFDPAKGLVKKPDEPK